MERGRWEGANAVLWKIVAMVMQMDTLFTTGKLDHTKTSRGGEDSSIIPVQTKMLPVPKQCRYVMGILIKTVLTLLN